MKILSLFVLLNVVQATTSSLCTVKRDVCYACYTQISNDMEAYETFFIKQFSECASATDLPGDANDDCDLKRESAYSTFTYFSNDMELFERVFGEKYPECGVDKYYTSGSTLWHLMIAQGVQ